MFRGFGRVRIPFVLDLIWRVGDTGTFSRVVGTWYSTRVGFPSRTPHVTLKNFLQFCCVSLVSRHHSCRCVLLKIWPPQALAGSPRAAALLSSGREKSTRREWRS